MCGLIGIGNFDPLEAASGPTYLGEAHQLHRGKESSGMATQGNSPYEMDYHGGMGEAPQVYDREILKKLRGNLSVGHTRYSTTGKSSSYNIQPIMGSFRGLPFAIAHNGNLINTESLKHELGITDESMSDTRVITLLIAMSRRETFERALLDTLQRLEGAFCFVILHNKTLYAIRDRHGFHPLQYARRPEGFVIASESCVFDHLNASEAHTDVAPGEIVTIKGTDVTKFRWHKNPDLKIDIFEYIYFLRPDSVVHDVSAYTARVEMGKRLSREHPARGDVVIPVADSGNAAAFGFSKESGIPLRFGLFRPHIVSRTFIEPVAEMREKFLENLKFNTIPKLIAGKDVIVVDDSIVRSTTMKSVNNLLRKAGAKSVSVRISSPPYLYPDFYGIDTYRKKDELIAKICGGDVAEIARHCGVDDLKYLSLEGLIESVLTARGPKSELTKDSFYTGPFTGEYPAGKGDFAHLV